MSEPRKFGICMDGCEEGLERLLRETIAHSELGKKFTYVEIGVGYGGTLKAITDILDEGSLCWTAIGIDIPDGWSLNVPEINKRFPPAPYVYDSFPSIVFPVHLGVSLYLHPAAALLNASEILPIDFALIDGCHGKACVTEDFLAVARHARPGTVIAFHDAGESEQGGPLQPHCQTPIAVHDAIRALGLFDNHPDWVFLEMLPGDKDKGGNSCACFRKKG